MSELPEGWAEAELGDVLNLKYGKSLPAAIRNGGNAKVYGSNGVVGSHDAAITSGPTVIIGRKGSVGEVHLCTEPCWPIDTTYFIDDFGPFESSFLKRLLQSFVLRRHESSTAIPGLSRSDVYDLRLPVPPLAEQRRIVAAVDALGERVNRTKARLSVAAQTLKRLRSATIVAACSGDLTEQWRESHQADPWTETTFGNLLQLVTSGSRGWAQFYSSSGPLFLRSQDINTDTLCLSDVAHVDPPTSAEGARTRVERDDLLVTITGANVAKAAHANTDIGEAYVNQHVALLRPRDRRCSPWLHLWLISPACTRAGAIDAAYGAGKPGLNLTNIRDVTVSLPSPAERTEIQTQVRMVIQACEAIAEQMNAAEIRTLALERAIQETAFAGELVPTEAELARAEGRDYESGEQLLARMGRERQASVMSSRLPKPLQSAVRATLRTRSGPSSRRKTRAARAR